LWAGLWALMPLSAGLILFMIGAQRRQTSLMMSGVYIVVASAGAGSSLLLVVSGHVGGAALAMGAGLAVTGMVMVGSSLGPRRMATSA
jgi:hypothetical protein